MDSVWRKVLFIVHGHPWERPGGAEVYAWELYQAMRNHPAFEPSILTRTGTPPANGPPVWADADDPNHYWLWTGTGDFDFLYQEVRTPGWAGVWLDRLLRTVAPDVVHVQHTLFVGLDAIRRVRKVVPAARVVYTLHEFFPICHHRGLLFRPQEGVRCSEATPARCHQCFPDVSPESFAVREKHVRSRLAGVDAFIAPSRFLRDRFIDWGLPAARIAYEEYGRLPQPARPPRPTDGPRNRFAYFGQVNPFKGVDVLLRAALLLARDGSLPGLHVDIHGANLELQPRAFQQAYRELLARAVAAGVATDHGPYSHGDQARLIAEADWVVVPSVWWENSPLVIQEAFGHGRPVIASDIGGTAEKVADGVDGLHFRAGDSAALAAAMRTAAATPGLWDRLRAGTRPPYAMTEHLGRLAELYRKCGPVTE